MPPNTLIGSLDLAGYRKVVVAQGSLVPGRKVTGSVGNLSSLASYYILVYTCR